jgi:outer membrane protein assembly factor BamD (BamD/ComL family)
MYLERAVRVEVDPAHVHTKRLGGDLYNAISLARHLHEEQHQIGIPAFEAKYGVSMKELAIAQTEEFLTLFPEYRDLAA